MFGQRKRNHDRQGVATVEFAVLLPVMVIILLGTIECTSMIFLQQSLEIVCYETVRTAARPQTDSTTANDRGNEVITARGLNDCTVSLIPSNITTLAQGTPITATANAGTSENSFLPVFFFPDRLTAEAVMVRQ